jgi:hypothetical protein
MLLEEFNDILLENMSNFFSFKQHIIIGRRHPRISLKPAPSTFRIFVLFSSQKMLIYCRLFTFSKNKGKI